MAIRLGCFADPVMPEHRAVFEKHSGEASLSKIEHFELNDSKYVEITFYAGRQRPYIVCSKLVSHIPELENIKEIALAAAATARENA